MISCVINAHNEGHFLNFSIKSVKAAQKHLLDTSGVASELVIVLDNPDQKTADLAQAEDTATILEVAFSDLGLSRNFAVENSKGDFVAFLDGDDLWGINWLSSAQAMISVGNQNVVFHPQVSYYFGHGTTSGSATLFEHRSTDKNFDKFMMCSVNPWTALCLASKELLLENPYLPLKTVSGLGFEDWSFNIMTLEKGVKHQVVPETAHFIRNKPTSSMRLDHFNSQRVFYPSTIWGNP